MEVMNRAITQMKTMKILSNRHINTDNNNDNKIIFTVLGTTGNLYCVVFDFNKKQVMCSCPDNLRSFQNSNNNIQNCKPCKHICMIYIKIFRILIVPDNTYISTVQCNMLAKLYHIYLDNAINNNSNINNDNNIASTTQITGDCPICYEELNLQLYKCVQCKNYFHLNCISEVIKHNKNKYDEDDEEDEEDEYEDEDSIESHPCPCPLCRFDISDSYKKQINLITQNSNIKNDDIFS